MAAAPGQCHTDVQTSNALREFFQREHRLRVSARQTMHCMKVAKFVLLTSKRMSQPCAVTLTRPWGELEAKQPSRGWCSRSTGSPWIRKHRTHFCGGGERMVIRFYGEGRYPHVCIHITCCGLRAAWWSIMPRDMGARTRVNSCSTLTA